jgi:hypothetical protein
MVLGAVMTAAVGVVGVLDSVLTGDGDVPGEPVPPPQADKTKHRAAQQAK